MTATTQLRLAITPLVVTAIAYALAVISNQLIYIGPIDRATFGWIVVIPLLCAAPTFAGFSWRAVTGAVRTRFAIAGGLVIGVVTSALLWQSAISVNCAPTHSPIELLPQSLMIGAIVGAGFFLACRLASGEVAAGHIGRGAVYGAVIQLVTLPTALILSSYVFFGLCQRP
jgi:hypothetical protein